MTATEAIIVIALAVAAWIVILVFCYKLDVANLDIKHLREEIEDVSAVLKHTREMRDVFAKSNRELEAENATLRRALQREQWFGTPHVEGTSVAEGTGDES